MAASLSAAAIQLDERLVFEDNTFPPEILFPVDKIAGFAPIFPDTCYHLTHYWPAAADIPVASDNPVH
ncbi:hypothetical protein, partial [Escherichia coli]|uniref:hypothetical protein n=1 Tax=Escherichia coli TaxID=562 RepID=UPI003F681607